MTDEAPAKKPRWRRWLRGFGFGLVGIVALLLGTVSTVLYTETGTRFGLQQGASFYAGMIPGDISFERAEGTLASGVTLEGFEIRDRHGRALVRSEHVRLGVDVGAALGRTIDVGTIEVRNAEVAVDGAFGDLAPEGPSDPTPPRDTLGPDLPFELVGQLELRNIELHDATQTLTRVHVLDAQPVENSQHSPAKVSIRAVSL